MGKYSAVTLFCEDIRIEKSEQQTLVGVLKDALEITKIPGALPRLAVFTRLSADVDFDMSELTVRFLEPSGKLIAENIIENEMIKNARDRAIRTNNPTHGVVAMFQLSMLPVESEGIFSVVCTVNGSETRSGYINIRLSQAGKS